MVRHRMRLAGTIIVNPQREILLLHRNTPSRKQWEIPGGKIERGESAEAAAVRETREELGVDVRIDKFLGAAEFKQGTANVHYSWFAATIITGTPHVVEHETFDDARYWSRGDLNSIKQTLSPNLQNFLRVHAAKL